MGFGLLKHFKNTKSALDQRKVQHVDHLILGDDLGALLQLIDLKKKNPEATIKWVVSRPFSQQSLIENYNFSVSTLRPFVDSVQPLQTMENSDLGSSSLLQELYKRYWDAKITAQKSSPLFYKDGKFFEFGGRAKPMALQDGEEFFLSKSLKVDVSSLVKKESWEQLDELFQGHGDIKFLESITKVSPSDLIDKNEWKLTFKDFSSITCENLHVSLSPLKFLNFIEDKKELTTSLMKICSSFNVRSALSVTFDLNDEVYKGDQTLFLPQSMTHDWGHFIVEFSSFENEIQQCRTLIMIQEDDPQPDDLGAKIKLLKRVLERVFPGIEKKMLSEYIRFDEEMLVDSELLDSQDDLLLELHQDYPTLHFVGQASNVPREWKKEKYLARLLLN